MPDSVKNGMVLKQYTSVFRDPLGAASRPIGMIGTLFASWIERGGIPAMQNSAEGDPQRMLNEVLFNQLLGGRW